MHILGKHKIALITTSNNEFSNVKIVIQKDWTFVKDHYFKPKGLIKLEKEIISNKSISTSNWFFLFPSLFSIQDKEFTINNI
jgi:hypothetical protein